MPAESRQQVPTLWSAYDAWLRRATTIISDSAGALDAMNVFPVSDSDTGSNLELTLRGIAAAATDLEHGSLDRVVQAAILSAHGNSGAIVAEMVASVCRALQHDHPVPAKSAPGALVAGLLGTVATSARRAVARPVAGTILTVADAAAAAARTAVAEGVADALGVAEAAQSAARTSLARTPQQLPVLAAAGVVDAGGQAFSLLVDVLVEILGGVRAEPLGPSPGGAQDGRSRPAGTRAPSVMPSDLEYEVMYALRGAEAADLDALREELSALGHSVVIVGDQAVAQVHVHLKEAGAAVEAALDRGRLSQVRITALPPDGASDERVLIAVVAGEGLAEAVGSLGAVPVLSGDGVATAERLTRVAEESCGDLVILPNDMESLEIASHLAPTLRSGGRRVAVIPTVAQVQGLAAIAVHEPTADFESVVVAMSSAAGHARHGAVTVAEGSAMTMAGRCQRGDVLGVVEGDFVHIGGSVADVAWQVVKRLLSTGGELLTIVRGIGADDALVDGLVARVRRRSPAVDIQVLDGGQPRYVLLLGLE